MKTLIKIAALLLAAFFCNTGFSCPLDKGKTKDSTYCLELVGRITKGDHKEISTYTVELIHENTVTDTVTFRKGDSFKFFLQQDSWYAVRILKKGCFPKLISISTFLPPKKYDDYFYKLSFVVDEPIDLLESEQLDQETLDFPLAIFNFDEQQQEFVYNETYSKNIKKSLCASVGVEHHMARQ